MRRDHPVAGYSTVVDDTTQFLDVRDRREFAGGSIPGARNVPLAQLPEEIAALDPERRVVVVCRSGGRSAAACDVLVGAGFTDVINLAGGMLAWREGESS